MKKEIPEIELTEDQQMIELGRLAKDCLENEAFQSIMESAGHGLQEEFKTLTPPGS